MYDKKEKARNLRKNLTKQEKIIWQLIRKKSLNNLKFRRQYPIGDYIVDFVCNEKRLVIEIDGGQHNTSENILYDKRRTKYLESKGYRVLRFWNNDIDNNISGVYEEIMRNLSL